MFVSSNDEVEFTLITGNLVTFDAAEELCAERGTTLARISNQAEFDLVQEASIASNSFNRFWIGRHHNQVVFQRSRSESTVI